MQVSWYIAASYSVQKEYVTLAKLCIHASVLGKLSPSLRRNGAAVVREGERGTTSKNLELGSKCRKKEKKQHKRKAGKRPLQRSSAVAAQARQAPLGSCRAHCLLSVSLWCQASNAVDPREAAPLAELLFLFAVAARRV